MQKKLSKSPADKNVNKAPAIMEGFGPMMKRSFATEQRRLLSVQIATSPYIPNDAFRDGYDDIDWGNANKKKE